MLIFLIFDFSETQLEIYFVFVAKAKQFKF